MRFCAAYLTHHASTQEPADPVARFHLGNGARLERINWLGNTAIYLLAVGAARLDCWL
jgi:malonyl-CoA decarboxylase